MVFNEDICQRAVSHQDSFRLGVGTQAHSTYPDSQAPGTCAQALLSQRSRAACSAETGPLFEGGKRGSAYEMH